MTAIAWSVVDVADGVQRADFTDAYPTSADDVRAWADWCRAHGIDPDHVVCRSVERDEQARQVRFTAFVMDEQGRRIRRPDGEGSVKVPVVHQLETAPLPFPTLEP